MIAAVTWMTSQYRLQRRHQLRRLGVEHGDGEAEVSSTGSMTKAPR